jgi:hypothetical protein
MKPYEWIQSLYILLFGLLLSRRGFKWNWFLPLAGLFLVLTLLTVPEIGNLLHLGPVVSAPNDRLQLMAAPMMIIFYPLHAYVTVVVTRHLPKNMHLVESKIVKAAVYMGAAVVAGVIWVVFMGVIMMPFVLLQMK